MLECMKRHLSRGVKVYDPFITKDMVENQYHDFDKFLNDIDMIVILVGHDEIKNNMDKIKDKVILDTRNICRIDGTYRL